MEMSRKISQVDYIYKMDGNDLIITKSEKYLGILINDTLNWKDHCEETYTKMQQNCM